jgi:hypothetical protein
MVAYLIGIVLTIYLGIFLLFVAAFMIEEFGIYLAILLTIGGFFVIVFLVGIILNLIFFLLNQSEKHILSKMRNKPKLSVLIAIILYLALLIPALIKYLN